jgi:TonB family protein
VVNSLIVRNESALPLQCRMVLEQESPDDGGETHHEWENVIFPGAQSSGRGSFGPAALMPKSFSSKCVSVPATLPPDIVVPEECRAQVSGPSPDDFYPPGSKRRNEQGVVALEYAVAEGTTRAAGVRIVGSSGFQELDNAALKFAARMRVTSPCAGQRFRTKVIFKIRES